MLEAAVLVKSFTAAKDLSAFLLADIDIAEDLVVLVFAGLCAHHYRAIQRVAHFDGPGALHHSC